VAIYSSNALAARLRCYLVTDAAGDLAHLEERCAAALAGGVTTVQLRAKGLSDRELLRAARALRARCRAAGALCIVNDRVDIALAADADGVHLGVDDLPVAEARQLLGPHAIIGYSPDGDADRLAAERAGADYLGVGPVYSTSTKLDAGAAIGLDGLARVARATSLPVVGIGGITLASASDVLRAGAAGVAVVGAIWNADDPQAAARQLLAALDSR
jgi:thiamine-phosphate pyrophosphorylase